MADQQLVEVNPFRCRMWRMHDRLSDYLDDQSCSTELESFRLHGQRVPALGRRIPADADYDVELIYGARRLYVARQLNVKLLVELRTMTDREAVIAMDVENRHRKDVSPYERGMNLKALLREKYFESQSELSKTLGLSEARVSRLLRFAEIPYAVINAFPSPLSIRETWGVTIANWISEPETRQRVLAIARTLAAKKPAVSEESVFRSLLEVASNKPNGRKITIARRDEIFRDENGEALFRVSRRHKDVHIMLPLKVASSESVLRTVTTAIAEVLTAAKGDPWAPRRAASNAGSPGAPSAQLIRANGSAS